MHPGLPTDSFKAQVARPVQAAAVGCLLLGFLGVLAGAVQRGRWDPDALLFLEFGALLGFWLACLSYLLHKSKAALVLLWVSSATGFAAVLLLPGT